MKRLALGIKAVVTDEDNVQVQAVDEDQYIQVSERGGPAQKTVAQLATDVEVAFGIDADVLVLFTSAELTVKLGAVDADEFTVNGLYAIQGHTVSKIFVTNAATNTPVTLEVLAVKAA